MIGEPRFTLERLGPQHDRASFVCVREPALQTYFVDRSRALRDHERNVSAVHVLLDSERDGKVAGYFTLSNARIVPGTLPKNVERKFNRYPDWGALKLGRMARDDSYEGQGIGPILIARAFDVALRIANDSGSIALTVDAKNAGLVAWYEALGFKRFIDAELRLFITNEAMIAYLAAFENALQTEPLP